MSGGSAFGTKTKNNFFLRFQHEEYYNGPTGFILNPILHYSSENAILQAKGIKRIYIINKNERYT